MVGLREPRGAPVKRFVIVEAGEEQEVLLDALQIRIRVHDILGQVVGDVERLWSVSRC
jgi:hypothetical protein